MMGFGYRLLLSYNVNVGSNDSFTRFFRKM